MDAPWRARLASVALAAGAGVLAWMGQLAPAVVLLAGAAAVVVLVTSRTVPDGVPQAAARGAVEGLARLASSLELRGRGVVIPPEPAGASRLFVPARDVERAELPAPQPGTVVHRAPPGALGISLPLPGHGLEEAWRALGGSLPSGGGVAEGALHIRNAFGRLGLGAGTRVEVARARLRVVYTPLLFADLCRATRVELAPWATQGGCPACSLAAGLLARATGRPVRLAGSADGPGGVVELDLEVLA